MDELDRAISKYQRAVAAERAALADLHAAIRKVLENGERGTQAAVARRTGYTRERLRQIMKEGKS
ncbi:hypothetical protein [Nocardia asiatica]|uniref:hypothetical protein n=1 Tax=Nocardia asiatica TaxID=209252 RepID=UPI0002F66232|nr:hypothetical protein [Nocardia asiatica]